MKKTKHFSSAQQPLNELTSKRILRAAIREFSAHGLSGARTEAIADAAGVNKALLYYYFKSKQGLYDAAIAEVSGKVVEASLAALDPKYSAGERLLRTALNHFDRVLTQHEFQSLLQQEMVRFRRGEGGQMPALFQTVFGPLLEKFQQAVEEGIASGELCEVDAMQVAYAVFGSNVFHFMTAPLIHVALSYDPLHPTQLRSRRISVAQFLGNALFTDRARGAKLARKVLTAMPMPQAKMTRRNVI
jgi:TetR/AcrR family transcriptional regulator